MPQASPTSAPVSSRACLHPYRAVLHPSHPAMGCVSPGSPLRYQVQRAQDTRAEVILEVLVITILNPKDS